MIVKGLQTKRIAEKVEERVERGEGESVVLSVNCYYYTKSL